ncbi:Nse4 protein [Teladorsagia circumcincta]|uniref:Non-structural maintenance of chromosomes element 4 n=1 Tax=Teladorsagia circumcincta TaxID=45464 RepID=A0A2G9UVH2_TELCI|nr:Nse4 protein [Teladorsagia circumcincta]
MPLNSKRFTDIQIQEANYLNSLVTEDDPSQQFAKRASLREAYHDICSQFTGETKAFSLSWFVNNVMRVFQVMLRVGAGGKELAADADSLLSMASVLLEQMKSFRSANSERVVTAASFAEALISRDQWAWLGRQDFGTLTYDVSFNYQSLRSVVSYDTAPPASQITKKERFKRGKDTQEAAVLDKVRKSLKRAWKEKPSVDFFSFVIDPTDFSKSVENMFYVSFLVKDGRVRLTVGEDGLPVLLHVSNEERQRLHVDDRSAAVTNQAIISFTYEMWEEMVEAMRARGSVSNSL